MSICIEFILTKIDAYRPTTMERKGNIVGHFGLCPPFLKNLKKIQTNYSRI